MSNLARNMGMNLKSHPVHPEAEASETRATCCVLLLSGFCGFLVGFAHTTWQWAAEQAQVIAGIVSYPPLSPIAIVDAKLWCLVPQIGSLLLWIGISELALSKILSGMLGLLSFQALAIIVY